MEESWSLEEVASSVVVGGGRRPEAAVVRV
jgi:hypothetical protein